MNLELTDEQTWLSESIDTLLAREWVGPDAAAGATPAERDRLWERLAAFGALMVDAEDGLGAVELCLAARALGAHLASVPYLGSAAVRFALEPVAGDLAGDEERISVALLEPGRGWSVAGARTSLADDAVSGHKVAVEHADGVDRLAVVASAAGEPALALVAAAAPGCETAAQPYWREVSCAENNNHIEIGKEAYMISADGLLMPVLLAEEQATARDDHLVLGRD